jgi:hypothetical protein
MEAVLRLVIRNMLRRERRDNLKQVTCNSYVFSPFR